MKYYLFLLQKRVETPLSWAWSGKNTPGKFSLPL